MKSNELFQRLPSRAEMEQAFSAKDATYDGIFYAAVLTTGVFCRPSCPSRPKSANVEFFASVKECLLAGYRPCKRCRPLEATGAAPAWVKELAARVETSTGTVLRAGDLRALGITPERARRWFLQHYGMSFAAWCRARRLAGAFARIRDGASLDDAVFESGFESHSGFREAFARTFADPPGRSRQGAPRIVTTSIESPLGPLVAGGNEKGICLLEFIQPHKVKFELEVLQRRFGCAVVPGELPLLDRLRQQLEEYFVGKRREFDLPLVLNGTAFQRKVWEELRRIPFAETLAYDELARRIGQPTAQRAVARANAVNRICILIPCHRVIGKDGSLTGYGGGLWRKRLLLELERSGSLPGEDTPSRVNDSTG